MVLAARRSSIPLPPTPLIGRAEEVQTARSRLGEATVRLLTLTGPAGVGKTRLAIEVASRAAGSFPDDVVWIDLAALADPSLLLPTVAHALGIRDGGAISLVDRLIRELDGKEILLVLDNFEQILPAAPDLATILSGSARSKLLVTSRSALRLRWECELPVLPLAYPLTDRLPGLADLAAMPSVHLFLERTRAIRPDFELTAQNAVAVAELCARLDGLPLAIELAAARGKLLPLHALLARLDLALPLLAGGPADLPLRQRTMRDAIAWSYDLLCPREQALFRQVAVFAGGFTLDAALKFCATPGEAESDLLQEIASLVDKSLVRCSSPTGGEPRFAMLQLMREYGLEQLVRSGEADEAHRRHAAYLLELAEAAEPELEGPDQGRWLDRIEAELGNIRAALDWVCSTESGELAIRLAVALRVFWFVRGYAVEGRDRLARILDGPGRCAEPALRARALHAAAFLARHVGDYAAARGFIAEGLELLRRIGDSKGVADALSNLGHVLVNQGETEEARRVYGEALVVHRALANEQGIADALSHLAIGALHEGDAGAARSLDEESLAIWRKVGDQEGVAWALAKLGTDLLYLGDLPAARRCYEESLALSRTLGYGWGLARGLEAFAGLAAAQREPALALDLAAAAARYRDTIGIPLTPVERIELARRLSPAAGEAGATAIPAAHPGAEALTLEAALAAALALPHPVADERRRVPRFPDRLSAREVEVLALLTAGKSNQEIAAALVLSVRTVENHLARLYAKIGARGRVDAAAYAHRHNLVGSP